MSLTVIFLTFFLFSTNDIFIDSVILNVELLRFKYPDNCFFPSDIILYLSYMIIL